MIPFESFTLENGLRVIVHEDHKTPLAVVNIAYNVGARDEQENKTGFAHLFEHLMFGGSKNIPSFDTPLQQVGGENNAFTSNDLTNYYITLPAQNIETAFWLESDRMLSLSFDPRVLEVQRKVVIEEFKQMYLNQPYGDVWLKLRPLAYQNHPYKWPTIGKEISHIEQATMEDVKDFFFRFYRPNNAVLVVAGDVTMKQVKHLAEKWFGPIPAGEPYERKLPTEPRQTGKRSITVEDKVPQHALYKAFHMPAKTVQGYHVADLMGDILGRGKSSRFYSRLVKEQKLFSELKAYITGSHDPGLFIISCKLNDNIGFEQAEEAIDKEIAAFAKKKVDAGELLKVQNQAIFTVVQNEMELLNRAMDLAEATLLGDTNRVNTEIDRIKAVDTKAIKEMANMILVPENCTSLYYKSKKQKVA